MQRNLCGYSLSEWCKGCPLARVVSQLHRRKPQLIGYEPSFNEEKIKPGLIVTETPKPGLLNGWDTLKLAEEKNRLLLTSVRPALLMYLGLEVGTS